MYKISSSIYLELAERLMALIGDKEFFSGVVVCYDGDICCRLVCTLIVGRESVPSDGRNYRAIERIMPVWWELQTAEGESVIENDFSFDLLRRTILGD